MSSVPIVPEPTTTEVVEEVNVVFQLAMFTAPAKGAANNTAEIAKGAIFFNNLIF
jgi:hypothetical protein